MVGLVLVSHSAAVAEGAAALAREMGGEELALEPAGGLDEPDQPLGTDPALVAAAMERADDGDGVVVLMDLGSAVLSADAALELVGDELRERVVMSAAPLVEGAVAGAVAARSGAGRDEVAAEAARGLAPKQRDLGEANGEPAPGVGPEPDAPGEDALELRFTVDTAHGLHARPAARLVRAAQGFDARAELRNVTEDRGPANARSFADVATLGARSGHEVLVTAWGAQARELLDALEGLARDRFGEGEDPADPDDPEPRIDEAAAPPADGDERRLVGPPAAPGLALEPARLARAAPEAAPARAQGSPEEEAAALDGALEAARADLAAARSEAAARAGAQAAEIFDAHLLMLEDDDLVGAARRSVLEEGEGAGAALRDAIEAAAGRFRALEDPYLSARADDVEDAGRRVLARLAGEPSTLSLAESGVLVAEDLTPADVLGLPEDLVRGVATARGAPTSHAAVLARALGVPAVVGLGPRLMEVGEGTALALDGAAGVVLVEPDAGERAAFAERALEERASAQAARRAAAAPAITRDGHRVAVTANAASAADARAAVAAGAEGVGLLRTEFLFHGRDAAPSEEEQEDALREIAEALDGRPLVVRTLDAGADKPLPYLARREEENPYLGLRGTRLSLAEPELLAAQLRAVVAVAAEHPLSVMFPMVTTPAELERARELVPEGATLPVGIMVEVPAAALGADGLAARADFLSIGTNDLAQYTMAAERGNAAVAELGDGLAPPVLELISRVVAAGERRGSKVSVCGELAADPQAAPILVGLGVEELSVAPAAVPAVKAAVRELELAEARALAAEALGQASAAEVRALVRARASPSARTPASRRYALATSSGSCWSMSTRELSSRMTSTVSGRWTSSITFWPCGPIFCRASLRMPNDTL